MSGCGPPVGRASVLPAGTRMPPGCRDHSAHPGRSASGAARGVMAIMRSSAVNSSRPVANFSVGADRQAGLALLGEYDLRGELQLLQPDGGGAHVDGDDSSVGSLRGEGPFDGHTQPLQQLPGGCGARWSRSRCTPWPRDSQSIIPAGRRRRWRSPGTRRIRSAPAPAAMVPGSHQRCHRAVGSD